MEDNYTNRNADNAILDSLTKFQGFYSNIYRDPFITGNAFIFVTKPLLFIDYIKPNNNETKKMLAYLNMTKDPTFSQYMVDEILNSNDKKIVEMLSYNQEKYNTSNFIPLFTNECKGFDSNDTNLEGSDSFDTKQGYRESLPTHKTASEASNSLSIPVLEDSNLSFTKLLTLWVNYISNISDGTFDANPDMILNGVLDYMCSIYYFVLGPDGRTLKYWCKYTGCWPTNIPYGMMRYTRGQNDLVELSVPFQYTIKEDMNPKILEDFNIVSMKLVGKTYERSIANSGLYSSIKDSPLLNLNRMKNLPNGNILSTENHDPVVLYVPGNNNGIYNDSTSDHFELLFNKHGYRSNFLNDVFDGNDYFINDEATDFIGEGYSTVDWSQSNFWK